MIKLSEINMRGTGRRSSKGNQLKFEKDGMWYKTDYLGYEGLVEYTVSKLLKQSNLKPNEFVDYELEEIEYNGNAYRGCKSEDFLHGRNLITLERLFKDTYGYGLNKIVYSIPDHRERLKKMIDQIEKLTGIENVGVYMSRMLTIDALFLNEDRHTHNIAVIIDESGKYEMSPVFDNGAGLLSDTVMEYPLGRDYIKLIDKVKSKTFSDDFSEQVDIAEELYGENIYFTFSYDDVEKIVNSADIYEEDIRHRVIDTIMQMRSRYSYLFKKCDT